MDLSEVIRVLCVEDDADSREMMKALLGATGYEVVTASTPGEGLALAVRGGFALIIMDNWYGEGSGVELCKQIRKYDALTPILFYSGAGKPSDIEAGLRAGAQAYIVKPEIEQLMLALAQLLGCDASGGYISQ